ncbi:MAG TPA: hypothetical protein VFM27_11755 [Acidimicrobiales bacterium]|nr:hypothetical protein [Acidimicrobiales bacterium]
MTQDTTCVTICRTSSGPAPAVEAAAPGPGAEGWQLLAGAELGRALTEAELSTAERLPPPEALDLLFPSLSDAARQEALWALAQP